MAKAVRQKEKVIKKKKQLSDHLSALFHIQMAQSTSAAQRTFLL